LGDFVLRQPNDGAFRHRVAGSIGGVVLVVLLGASLGIELTGRRGSADVPRGAPIINQATPPASFVAVGFKDLPGWDKDDHLAAFKAFVVSCPRIKAAGRAGNKAGDIAIPPALIAACDAAAKVPAPVTRAAARAFFEREFTPHRVVHAAPQGLLTGYYEPVLDGSRTPTQQFATPIYKRPADLVNLVHEAQRGAKADQLTHARKTDKGTEPYSTRAEIEAGALTGKNLELLYLADPVDTFFMHIQGSGRIKLTDGTTVRVHYDGKNGHPYTSIGRYLIDQGILAADKISLGALRRWLRTDQDRGRQVMHQNASFVFFRELAGDEASGPLGVLSIPLVAGRSLAVDAGVHAIGTPVFVSSTALTHASEASKKDGFHRLMVAHDVGSAIRGPERGDIYFGSGDKAGRLAGVTKHPGTFFVLLPGPAAPTIETGTVNRTTPARARRATQ
jgi:membrane-bound lytic murein transglycosylase A